MARKFWHLRMMGGVAFSAWEPSRWQSAWRIAHFRYPDLSELPPLFAKFVKAGFRNAPSDPRHHLNLTEITNSNIIIVCPHVSIG